MELTEAIRLVEYRETTEGDELAAAYPVLIEAGAFTYAMFIYHELRTRVHPGEREVIIGRDADNRPRYALRPVPAPGPTVPPPVPPRDDDEGWDR
jgi:hypothetical protein